MKDIKGMFSAIPQHEKPEQDMKRQKAREEVLQELLQMAEEGETQGLMSGLQKITISASDKAGLQRGLAKAEQMLASGEDMPSEVSGDDEGHDEMAEMKMKPEEEMAESEEDEEMEEEA